MNTLFAKIEKLPVSIVQHYQPGKYQVTDVHEELGKSGQRMFVVQYIQIGMRWSAAWAQEKDLWLPTVRCLGEVKKQLGGISCQATTSL